MVAASLQLFWPFSLKSFQCWDYLAGTWVIVHLFHLFGAISSTLERWTIRILLVSVYFLINIFRSSSSRSRISCTGNTLPRTIISSIISYSASQSLPLPTPSCLPRIYIHRFAYARSLFHLMRHLIDLSWIDHLLNPIEPKSLAYLLFDEVIHLQY